MKQLLAGVLLLALATAGPSTLRAASDEEKIQAVVDAVIKAYSSGNYDSVDPYFAPEVTMVPANYAPPVKGWTNVKTRYQQATANLEGTSMYPENTTITRRGKTAWVVYQWRFAGIVNGQPIGALGHTTLVMEKRSGKWVIVHNHTSALPTAPQTDERTSATEPATRD